MYIPDLPSIQYLQHRRRLKDARPRIDNSMPIMKLHVGNTIRLEKTLGNGARCRRIYNHNTRVLHAVNTIARRTGRMATSSGSLDLGQPRISNVPFNCRQLDMLEQDNFNYGRRLLNVTSTMQSIRHLGAEDWRKRQARFEVPREILSKYKDSVRLPANQSVLQKLLRPIVFFDLAVRNRRFLGRIIIQLYTEACPQVVLEFVRACKSEDTGRLQIMHLFPNLWLEGELLLKDQRLRRPNIEYDMRAIDHGQSAGVLSFARHHLDGIKHGILDFSISFKPLSMLNGKRVGFGRVLDGLRLLNSLRKSGTKNGRPHEDLVVQNWGIL